AGNRVLRSHGPREQRSEQEARSLLEVARLPLRQRIETTREAMIHLGKHAVDRESEVEGRHALGVEAATVAFAPSSDCGLKPIGDRGRDNTCREISSKAAERHVIEIVANGGRLAVLHEGLRGPAAEL